MEATFRQVRDTCAFTYLYTYPIPRWSKNFNDKYSVQITLRTSCIGTHTKNVLHRNQEASLYCYLDPQRYADAGYSYPEPPCRPWDFNLQGMWVQGALEILCTTHSHHFSYADYRGILPCPLKRATKLHGNSFDHGSHYAWLRSLIT